MKWQMEGFRFIYQTPCVQKHVRRLLPNVEGLTEMDLFTADRSCVSVSLHASVWICQMTFLLFPWPS